MTRLESARMKTPRGSDPKILYLRLVSGSIPPKDRYFGGGHGHFCLESGRNGRFLSKICDIGQNRPNLAARAKNGVKMRSLKIAILARF